MNNRGDVVGEARFDSGADSAFYWRGGHALDLGSALPFGGAQAIAAGGVAGCLLSAAAWEPAATPGAMPDALSSLVNKEVENMAKAVEAFSRFGKARDGEASAAFHCTVPRMVVDAVTTSSGMTAGFRACLL